MPGVSRSHFRFFFFWLVLHVGEVAALPAASPNVLFIAVDDMRVELGCYGDGHVHSPNIDRLAAEGILFERAYCQQAVCNPSRASLLTGLRPSSLRLWDLPTHFRERLAEVTTLPQWFLQEGYHAQNIGKIFHNWRQPEFKGDPASWSVPAVMHYASHGSDKPLTSEDDSPRNLSSVPRTEMCDVDDEAYFDGRIANLAIDALEERQISEKPFFLAVGFWKPHAPFNAPKSYWDLYDLNTVSLPSNPKPPSDVPALALHDGREIRRGFSHRPGGVPTKDETLALRRGYLAAISYVDAQIGKVISALDRLNLRDSTIVVLWSDHGFHLGEHGLWAKTSNFEWDARVPLIFSVPGLKGGRRVAGVVELLDLYPTLVDLCGGEVPERLEGVSLRPMLEGTRDEVKDAAFTWHPRPAYPAEGKDPEFMGYSMRTERFRYTEWRRWNDEELIARELYDHKVDSEENHNVVGQEVYADSVKALAWQLAASGQWGGANPAKSEGKSK